MANPNRLLIIGLDGADYYLIQQWVAQGELPHIGELVSRGTMLRARSTLPPMTAPAWTTIFTGCNPGKHGVFDFLDFSFPKRRPWWQRPLGCPDLFQHLSLAGISCGGLNVPMIYPARSGHGVMVSGFGCPWPVEDAIYPDSARETLFAAVPDYEQSPDSEVLLGGSPEALVRFPPMRGRAAAALLDRYQFEVFVVVFGALDWAAHSHVGGPDGFDGLPLTVAKAIDAEVGRLVARTDWPRTHVIMVSDHGMARAEQEVNLIRLLCDLGLLQLQRHKNTITLKGAMAKALLAAWKPAKRVLPADLVQKLRARSSFRHNLQVGGPLLTIDWDKTTVFPATSYGALRMGIRERPPGGPVARKDAERVRSEVMQLLSSAADPSGRALFAEVLAGDEVYHGPWMQAAPDILLKPASRDLILSAPPWGGNLLLFMEEPGLIRPVAPALGTHTMDAMLVLSGERVRTERYGSECNLEDVAPTVLHLLGLPVPPVMDGRALTEHLADEPIASATDCLGEQVVHTAATYADEERLKARLQALGYL